MKTNLARTLRYFKTFHGYSMPPELAEEVAYEQTERLDAYYVADMSSRFDKPVSVTKLVIHRKRLNVRAYSRILLTDADRLRSLIEPRYSYFDLDGNAVSFASTASLTSYIRLSLAQDAYRSLVTKHEQFSYFFDIADDGSISQAWLRSSDGSVQPLSTESAKDPNVSHGRNYIVHFAGHAVSAKDYIQLAPQGLPKGADSTAALASLAEALQKDSSLTVSLQATTAVVAATPLAWTALTSVIKLWLYHHKGTALVVRHGDREARLSAPDRVRETLYSLLTKLDDTSE